MKKNASFNLYIIFISFIFIIITLTGPLITIKQYTEYQGTDIEEIYIMNFFGFWKKKIEPINSEYPGQIKFTSGVYQDFGIDYIPFPYYGTILTLLGFLFIALSSFISLFNQNKYRIWIKIIFNIIGLILPIAGLYIMLCFNFEIFEPFISQIYQRTETISIDFGFSLLFGWGFFILVFSTILNIINTIGLYLIEIQPTSEINDLSNDSEVSTTFNL